MGLFGGRKPRVIVAPRPPKRKRATKAEVAERLKAQIAAEKARLELDRQREEREFLAWLKENDPQRYRAMIEKRMGLGEGDKGETGPANMWSALAEGAKNMPQLAQALRGGPQFPPDAVHVSRQDYEELRRLAGLVPTTGQPQPDAAPVAPAPAPSPAPVAAPPMAALPQEPAPGQSWGAFIVSTIEPMAPEAAASWLWGLRERAPEVGDALGTVSKLPDYALPLAFKRIASTDGFRELGDWCVQRSDGRALDVIHALQRLATQAA